MLVSLGLLMLNPDLIVEALNPDGIGWGLGRAVSGLALTFFGGRQRRLTIAGEGARFRFTEPLSFPSTAKDEYGRALKTIRDWGHEHGVRLLDDLARKRRAQRQR